MREQDLPVGTEPGEEPLLPLAKMDPATAASQLARDLLPGVSASGIVDDVQQFIATTGNDERQRLRRIRRAAVTLMQSPEYQLC